MKTFHRIYRIVNYTPGMPARAAILISSWLLVLLVGWLHYITGPDIEFHSYFLVPVIITSWYLGTWGGVVTTLLCAIDWLVVDLMLSTHDRVSIGPIISEAIRSSVFLVVIFFLEALKQALSREAALARLDPLTQIANRRAFFEMGKTEFGRAMRYGYPLTIGLIDLDNFKDVNDTLGHDIGDRLLQKVSDILSQHTRSSDLVGRLGGDEFVILMPQTNQESAESIAGKLHQVLLDGMNENQWPVTFSIGVAIFHAMPEDFDGMVKAADTLMYDVKGSGKNQVRCKIIT